MLYENDMTALLAIFIATLYCICLVIDQLLAKDHKDDEQE